MLHRRSSSAMPAAAAQLPPLEDENLLGEILLRLPPLPSSLPRATLVCKRWLGILSDHGFFRRFRKHHGKPPLLGYFFLSGRGAEFVPTLDPPDRIPAARFSLPPQSHHQSWFFLGCRHGLCLFIDFELSEAVVCDPLNSHQRRIALPPDSIDDKDGAFVQNGGVLCVAGNGHVHGDCSLSPFKLVLLHYDRKASSVSSCLYQSESGVWGNIVSKTMPGAGGFITPSIHVGSALCWVSQGGGIVEFDIENQTLGVIEKPTNQHWSCCQLLRTQENVIGLAVLNVVALKIEIWARNVNSYGTARLVFKKPLSCTTYFRWDCRWVGVGLIFYGDLMKRLVRFFFLWIMMSSWSTFRRWRSETFLQDSPTPISPATIIPTGIFYTAVGDGHRGTKGTASGRGKTEDDQCQVAGTAGGGRT